MFSPEGKICCRIPIIYEKTLAFSNRMCYTTEVYYNSFSGQLFLKDRGEISWLRKNGSRSV